MKTKTCLWKTKKINQWITLVERPVELEDNTSYQLVTVRRGFAGVESRGIFKGKEIKVKNYFVVQAGDFLISKRQIAHGACGIVPESLDGAVVSNEYNVFVPQKETNIEFFFLIMQLPYYKRLFYLMSDGVHIEKLLFKTNDWMKRSLSLPPLHEQQKIAAILSTQDKVIELKEKLLAQKQQQKKYLMQQLLTGKKRLPGFNGEWQFAKLENVSKYSASAASFKTYESHLGCGPYPVYDATGCFGNIDFYENEQPYISIVKDGAGAGRVALCKAKSSTIGTLGCIFANDIDLLYLFYWMSAVDFQIYSNGSTIPHVYYKDYKNVQVHLPCRLEQEAIVEILSTADHEIDLLQKSIEAEKQKKKALMQLLLTGAVRVK